MSDQPHTGPGQPASTVSTTGGAGTVDSTGDGSGSSGGELATRFANPGIPAHVYRRSDIDTKAAQRREREVATFFAASTLGTAIFMFGYFFFTLEDKEGQELVDALTWSNRFLGVGLGLAFLCIGLGAIHWAKTLMPDDEVVNERKPMRSSDEDRQAAVEAMKEGAAGAGLGRRKLIRNSLLGALAPLGLLALVPLRDLGPLPGAALTATAWKSGKRLVTDPTGRPVRAADIPIGGVVHVLPEGLHEEFEHPLNEEAKATTLVMRLEPDELREDPDRASWSYNGIVAYSKICTHVGCPVGLYEQQTHHLLCPCHQSTFDVTQHCKVIFGPAARPLPQLPIGVDDEGYLIATDDFQEPIGPSYWERGE